MSNLIPCRSCNGAISRRARTCSHCGVPLKSNFFGRWRITVLVMAFLYVGFHDQMHEVIGIPDLIQPVHTALDRALDLTPSTLSIDLSGTKGEIVSVSVDPDLLYKGLLPEAERQEIADWLLSAAESIRSGDWPSDGQQLLASPPPLGGKPASH